MAKIIQIIIVLVAFNCIQQASAQSTFIRVSGKLQPWNQTESKQLKLEVKIDSTIHTIQLDTTGNFDLTIEKPQPLIFKLELEGNVTYHKFYISVDTTLLIECDKTENLEEITVQSIKEPIKKYADKTIYTITQEQKIKTTSLMDLICSLQGINCVNNSIQIIGKEQTNFWINNKEIQMQENQLITYLSSILPEQIEKIEIITQPSFRYTSERNTGIIAIKLKKQSAVSQRLNSTAQLRIGEKLSGTLATDYTVNRTKWEYQNNLLYNNINQEFTTNNSYELIQQKNQALNGKLTRNEIDLFLVQQLNLRHKRDISSFVNVELGNVTSKHTSKDQLIQDQTSFENDLNQASTGKYVYVVGSILQERKNRINQLTINGAIRNVNNSFYNSIKHRDTLVNDIALNQLNVVKSLQGQATMTIPTKTGDITIGAKTEISDNPNRTTSPAFTENYTNTYFENNNEIYTEKIGSYKKMNYRTGIGLIYSQLIIRTNTTLNRKLSGINFQLNIQRQIDSNQTITLAVNRKLTRPTFDQLNPNKTLFSIGNYQVGNPYLLPYYFTEITGEYTPRTNFSVQINYFRGDNVIEPLTTSDSIETARNSYYNNSTEETYRIQITYTKKLTQKLEAYINSSLGYNINQTKLEGGNSINKGITGYNEMNIDYSISEKKGLYFNMILWNQLPSRYALTYVKGLGGVDFNVKFKPKRSRISTTLQFRDIFRTQQVVSIERNSGNIYRQTYYADTRSVQLKFSYSLEKRIHQTEQKEIQQSILKERI